MANKIGRNKKKCEKYRNSGRREENKKLRQERNVKRIERFVKRQENGKTYTYRNGHAKEKLDMGQDDNYIACLDRWKSNHGSGRAMHTDVSKWKSIMRKVTNDVNKQIAAEKELERKENKKK